MNTKQHTEIRGRILTRAEEMFLKFGFSKVTMDEIASNSGVSKKTLYTFFLSKEELLRELILNMRCTAQDRIENIFSSNETDFIEKLRKLMNLLTILYIKFDGPLLEDLHKNVPDLWQQVNEFGEENVVQYIMNLISQGVEKGILRKDIDHRLIAEIFLSAVKRITNYEILAQIPISSEQVFESLIKVIFSGIFTKEGRTRYNTYQMAK